MVTNSMLLLRYLGVIPQTEYVEYGFRIEDKNKDPRLIVMMIESGFFKKYDLMFQELPWHANIQNGPSLAWVAWSSRTGVYS